MPNCSQVKLNLFFSKKEEAKKIAYLKKKQNDTCLQNKNNSMFYLKIT